MKTVVITTYIKSNTAALNLSTGAGALAHVIRVQLNNLMRLAIRSRDAMTSKPENIFMLLFIIPCQSFNNIHVDNGGMECVCYFNVPIDAPNPIFWSVGVMVKNKLHIII